MRYYSTRDKNAKVTLDVAVLKGLAPDGGLFMPEQVPELPENFFEHLHKYSLPDISFVVAKTFFGDDVPKQVLEEIVHGAMNFDVPLVELDNDVYTLELFHGPTLAFKDVGARFMSRLMGWLVRNHDKETTVLVATSGDTGSAVAQGFAGVEGVRVVILYPSGMVSPLQEKQLTTGEINITALEVKGTFDDCQRMVKQAFSDASLAASAKLTSANSINIARLIPQSFYYFHGLAQLGPEPGKVVICVPSGNFGNLTAGLLAKRKGLDVHQFIAATNRNKVFVDFLEKGKLLAKPSVQTFSNAMDVGDPSNFERIVDLYNGDHELIKQDIKGYSIDDDETLKTIQQVKQEHGYLLDPHGAVGYASLKKYQQKERVRGVFLETAHPAKFGDVVKEALGQEVELPEQLKKLIDKPKRAHLIDAELDALREFLQ